MECNASDYEVVDNNLFTEEKSDNITIFMPDGSEDVLTQDEELSGDSVTTENPATTATFTVINFATVLDSVHNLTLTVKLEIQFAAPPSTEDAL